MSSAPYFDDLAVGQLDVSAPAVTLTDGMAALHRAIVGDRLPLALDATLASRVAGAQGALAHPALVWDLAIGQSTVLTGRVLANLFYRGLVLKRFPVIGDTLSTSTEVVALRHTTPRPGRRRTGLAVLRVRAADQHGRAVLDFWRCAMLPVRDPDRRPSTAGSFDQLPAELDGDALRAPISGWDLDALPAPSECIARLTAGARWRSEGGDVVSSAPELARLTLNVAAVHHDRNWQATARRLVYGGHTIGLAAAQASRLVPEIVTILGWHSCEHVAPIGEGDTVYTDLELERLEPLVGRGALAHLRARVQARPEPPEAQAVDVLDWRFVALVA